MSGFLHCIMPSGIIHSEACFSTSFIFMAEYYSIVWICHILFIDLPIDGHLGCFHLLAIMNNAATYIHAQVFVWTFVFISLGYILRSGIAGSYGNSV